MKVVFFGSAQIGLPSLGAMLADSDFELTHIFTQPAHKAGRGRKPRPTPVAMWADSNNIECTEAENINVPEMVQAVADCKAELLVVIAFGQKISQEVISLFDKGAINVHTSLLPKYRGAAPINYAVLNGDAETGVSIITLADRMDAGFVLGQGTVAIADDDTATDVHDKLAELAPGVLLKAMKQIADGSANYETQDESLVMLAPKLKKTDGIIDWQKSAVEICNKIRGLWAWPGAKAEFHSQKTSKTTRVTIAKAKVVDEDFEDTGDCGTVDEDLNVICGKGKLKIIEIKPAGKGLMDFKSFVNGRAVAAGDKFTIAE